MGSLHWDVVVRADRLPALDETLMGRGVAYRFGGKGGNQALAAARAGVAVTFAGAVGDDDAGRRMLRVLDDAGIERSAIDVRDGASGMSVAIETAGGEYGAVVVTGANAAVAGAAMPRGCRVALIQNEVPEAANLSLAASLPADVALVWNAAPARGGPDALLDRADVLVVNRVEAAQMGGIDALRRRVTVIETLGADGCRLGDAGGVRTFPAAPVEVVSTHGAGDAFCGTLAAALARGASLDDAVAAGQAAAARLVSGADLAARDAVD